VSYVVVLELLNAIAIPAWVAILLPAGVRLSPGQLVLALLVLLVAPVVVGVLLARWRRGLAHWSIPLARVANLLVVVIIGLSIVRYHTQFGSTFTSPVIAVATLSTLVALGAGWVLCGPGQSTRIMAASITAVRSNGVALAIAQASFPHRPEVVAAVATFGLCSVLLPTVAAFVLASHPRTRRTFPARQVTLPAPNAKRTQPPG
jgi:predicted Na+-dependent transporter